MASILQKIAVRATNLGIPFSAHVDLTYQCNERCVHCYLDHSVDGGELSTSEVIGVLDQLAEAGTFVLTISGGEVFLRSDLFEILRHARKLMFCLKLKTNGLMLGDREAALLGELGVHDISFSVYSHLEAVHDGITQVEGSLQRTLAAVSRAKKADINVAINCVVMEQNFKDYRAVKELATELGCQFRLDSNVTPMLSGDESAVKYQISDSCLAELMHDATVVPNADEFCAVPTPASEAVLEERMCAAGSTLVYVNPWGKVFPCVQFPILCGDLRRQSFSEIWKHSRTLDEIRSVHLSQLPTCSRCNHVAACGRCPGLAFMQGDWCGPSSSHCKNMVARTGVPVMISPL